MCAIFLSFMTELEEHSDPLWNIYRAGFFIEKTVYDILEPLYDKGEKSFLCVLAKTE